LLILAVDLPLRAHPGKTVVHTDSETGESAADVVFLAHVGKVKVPEMVLLIKGRQESTVADGNITGHKIPFVSRNDGAMISQFRLGAFLDGVAAALPPYAP
jgi:hypothetical protein